MITKTIMKKTLYSRFDKKDITPLPQVTFPGRIITIISAGEAEKAVDYLLSSDILGVDTETKPAFHKGEHHQVALLQVSNRDTCFLFRLNLTGITPAIKRLLEDTTVKKIGLSWHDDLRGLQAREAFKPGLFVELQDLVPTLGVQDLSLQKLYANFFHLKMSKRQRLSNWEATILDEKQKQYAAIDAWTCINLYEEVVRLQKTHDYELVSVETAEPQAMSHDVSVNTAVGTEPVRNKKTRKARTRKTEGKGMTAKRRTKKTQGQVIENSNV